MAYEIGEGDVDAIREILNIGIGRSAQMLNCITQSHITLSIPDVDVYTVEQLLKESPANCSDETSATIKLEFSGSFSGMTAVSFPSDSAAKLVMALVGEDTGTPELDSIRIETLKEIGNIIVNGVMGSIGNVLKVHLNYSVPTYQKGSINSLITNEGTNTESDVLMARASFRIKDLDVEGNIFMVLEVGSMELLINCINSI